MAASSSASAFARNTSSRVFAASVAAALPSLPLNDAATNSSFSETRAHSTEPSMLNSGMANVQMNEGHFSGGDVEDVARTVFGGGDANAANGNFRRLLSAASTLPPEVKSLGTQLAKDPDIQRALIKHFHARLVGPTSTSSNAISPNSQKDDNKTTASATDDEFGVREIPLSDAEDEEEFHSPSPVASSPETSGVLVEPEVLARDQHLLDQFRISAMTTPTPPVRLSRMATPPVEQEPGAEGVPRVSSAQSGKNEAKEQSQALPLPPVAPAAPAMAARESSGAFVDFVSSMANGAARMAATVARKFEQIFNGLESYVTSLYHKPEDQPGEEMQNISSSGSSSSEASSSSSSGVPDSPSTDESSHLRNVLTSGLYFAAVVVGVLFMWKALGPLFAAAAAPAL